MASVKKSRQRKALVVSIRQRPEKGTVTRKEAVESVKTLFFMAGSVMKDIASVYMIYAILVLTYYFFAGV